MPRNEWNKHSLREITQPCSPQNTVTPDTNAANVLSIMSHEGDRGLIVVDNGRVVAFVSPQDLLHFLSAKLELEGQDARPTGKRIPVNTGKAA
jgi:CBS-domain-containing membrane protein